MIYFIVKEHSPYIGPIVRSFSYSTHDSQNTLYILALTIWFKHFEGFWSSKVEMLCNILLYMIYTRWYICMYTHNLTIQDLFNKTPHIKLIFCIIFRSENEFFFNPKSESLLPP